MRGQLALYSALSFGTGGPTAAERIGSVIADLEESNSLLTSGNLLEFVAGVRKLQSQVEQ